MDTNVIMVVTIILNFVVLFPSKNENTLIWNEVARFCDDNRSTIAIYFIERRYLGISQAIAVDLKIQKYPKIFPVRSNTNT